MPDSFMYDVVIAGAGPVGLFLACELRLADLTVLVLEQNEKSASPLKQLPFGMRGLSIPTVESFQRRGLLEALVAPHPAKHQPNPNGTVSPHWMQQPRRPGGHFAGIQFYLDNIDRSNWPYHLQGAASSPMATNMEHIESVLTDRAIALGVQIRRGLGVEDFNQSHEDVTIRAGEETFRGRWLVGCDGGRSTVRKVGGFEFVGTEPEFTGYSVEVELAELDLLRPGRHYTATGMYTFQQPGTVAMVNFDGGVFHRTQSITVAHVQSVLRHISCTNITVSALKVATTWTDRAYQAATYRNGRVLLAGDAAHIHSPLGGQGLNLGLGDAMNLGWKLASTLRGDAPDGLLDSYFLERHPVGAQILDWSRAQVAVMRPNRSSRALEAIIRDVMETNDGATYFAQRIWGLSVRYPIGNTNHPLVGRSAPAFEFAGGATLGEYLRNGKALLLDFDTGKPLQALDGHWGEQVGYLAGEVHDQLGLSAVLVRPDGIVAWASDVAPDLHEVVQEASQWFVERRPRMGGEHPDCSAYDE